MECQGFKKLHLTQIWSALSTHATACGAPCERVPCGVEHDLRILRYRVLAPPALYTPLFIQAPADMRSSARTSMLIPSGQASVSYPSAIDTLAHDSRRQGGISLMLRERAYPGEDGCA
ncbi:hypothetical protein B0H14DRAFT_3860975 [Mycena olivaceomarginata]|nr:hypothetical protein B0H14DRAFT_3860975 [Mycena olivaceomarginata]